MRKIIQKIYKFKIFKRIIPSLLKIYIKLLKKNEIFIRHKDINLKLNLSNPIDREIFLKGNYEKKQIDCLLNFIKDNKIVYFIDIGAHMGFYSLIISNLKIKVFSFEPVKNNFKQLHENKRLNKFENMEIYNFALSNNEKKVEMWVSNKEKTGGYTIYDPKDEELKKYDTGKINKEQCISKIGDEIIKINNEKVAIKIDVERHELNVLEGLNNLLKHNDIILQIELFEDRRDSIIKYLKERNFKHINTIQRDFYFKNF
jgi:FkbM family methyltransferase